jgi:hypothetical protein
VYPSRKPDPKEVVRYYLFIWILVQAFYWPTWNAGFVTDFTGLLERLDGSPARDILTSFGYPAQQQVLNFFLYLFYHAFGAAPLPWYLIHTGMHALNGLLLYLLVRRVSLYFGAASYQFAAVAATALFLLSPYQSEPVVWRVCFNYLLSTALLLKAISATVDWVSRNRLHFPWMPLLFFTIALFTFELAFSFPVLCLILLGFHGLQQKTWQRFPLRVFYLVVPQLLLIGGYLSLNRLTLGKWIGHYGAETHLNLSPGLLLGTAFQYTAKLIGWARHYPYTYKDQLFQWVTQPSFLVVAVSLLLIGLILLVRRFCRLSPSVKAAALFALCFPGALLPVLNIYFNYLLLVENDRHSYLASAFLFAAMGLLISRLPRYGRLLMLGLFLLPSALLLWRTNRFWKESTIVYHQLLDGFRWHEAEEVFILNLPDNLNGVMIFRDYGNDGQTFLDALEYLKGRPYRGTLREVASYNMTSSADGVAVTQPSPDSLTVTFDQWGNWWWRNGLGATNYQTDQYQFYNKGHHYELKWVAPPDNDTPVLFQDGAVWKTLSRY